MIDERVQQEIAAKPGLAIRRRDVFVRGPDCASIHAVAWGGSGGDDVLCLHGAVMNAAWWQSLGEHFAGVGYYVVAPDQRGYGRSDDGGDYSVDEAVGDLRRVFEALGLGPAVIIGHSSGGKLAAAFAVAQPGLVRGLVLVDPLYPVPVGEFVRCLRDQPCGPADSALGVFEIWERELQSFASFDEALDTIRRLRPYQPLNPINLGGWLAQVELREGRIEPRTRREAVFRGMRDVFCGSDLSGRLGDIRCPTLVVFPTRGNRPAALFGGAYLSAIPGARSVGVDGGHWVMSENPAGFEATLLEFLDELRRSGYKAAIEGG